MYYDNDDENPRLCKVYKHVNTIRKQLASKSYYLYKMLSHTNIDIECSDIISTINSIIDDYTMLKCGDDWRIRYNNKKLFNQYRRKVKQLLFNTRIEDIASELYKMSNSENELESHLSEIMYRKLCKLSN